MRYVSAYLASYSKIKTKADLKKAAKEGFNAEMQVEDPTGIGSGIMGINEIPADIILTVSNHPARTWYANVSRTAEGKVTVK